MDDPRFDHLLVEYVRTEKDDAAIVGKDKETKTKVWNFDIFPMY